MKIRLTKDIQAYNEGAPNRGPLKIPMISRPPTSGRSRPPGPMARRPPTNNNNNT